MTTKASLLDAGNLKDTSPEKFDVTFKTTAGDFVVQVTRAWAPLGADRFYNLVNHGFYDDAAFIRVIPGFVVQFGLSADPSVNSVWRKSNFKDDPVTQSNKPGFITFATAGPNTRTTQLFINTGNNAQLDRMGFAPFGQVTSGMDVVKKIHSGYGESPDQGSITALGKLLIQFAGINHYGFFRDEFYYMACGEHLAWGYVDQPPLIAFVAWVVSRTLGTSLFATRLFPVLAGAVVVYLTGRVARELGGGLFAQFLAAVAILLAPAYLAFDSFFSMNAFEPLFWLLCAWIAILIVKGASS